MSRYIDADALRDKLQEEIDKAIPPFDDVIGSIRCGVRLARNIVEDEPTIDAVPVRHGRWIKLDMHAHLADHKCTACGQECYVPTCMGEPMYTYCPNCGARMDGDRNEPAKRL